MQFPFRWPADELLPEDFERLALLFAQTIRSHFPCDTVSFERWDEAATAAAPELAAAAAAGEPFPDAAGSRLLLPFGNGRGIFGIAILAGCQPGLYGLLRSRTRLLAQHQQLIRELRQLKRWCTDPITGLLNGCHLREMLLLRCGAAAFSPRHLVLIEIYPWARNAGQGLRFIARIASQLDSFLGGVAPLHHLGSGVFAQFLDADEEQALAMGNRVLRWLQRENLVRGHIGLAALPEAGLAGSGEAHVEHLFEQAWQALHVARRRAPHALCTSAHLNSNREPLHRQPPPAVLREVRRQWRGVDRFALVLLHQDQAPAGYGFPEQVRSAAGAENGLVALSAREACLVLPGGREEADAWLTRFRRQLPAGVSYSMGIALFPCADFPKAEMVPNARKALLHTRFLGPASATVFDSVSLNISGDHYYEEGDLARAVREYRRGLGLDGTSVNLLNSLGVAYAQMNRYRLAIPLFEQALAQEPENFMALFNLGYAHLHFGEVAQAVAYFERALARDSGHFDLLLQLGKLYCHDGRYREAAGLLARAEGSEAGGRNGAGQGRIYSCLGQVHAGMGEHQQAISHLQRAMRYNPRDPGVISLLGELYAREGEGHEIALSLCRQAVELDDSRSEHWYRLALVHWLGGQEEEAEAAVRRSLRLDRQLADGLRLLGEICLHQGRLSQARRIWERLLRLRPGDREIRRNLQRLGRTERSAVSGQPSA